MTTVPSVGDRIEVFWNYGDQFYIVTVDNIKTNGSHIINFDYGDQEQFDIQDEVWRTPDVLNVNSINLPTLQSKVPDILRSILKSIGNMSFMLHQGYSICKRRTGALKICQVRFSK